MRLPYLPFLGSLLLMASAVAAPGQQSLDDIEQRLKTSAEREQKLREEASEKQQEVAALRRQLIETANSVQQAEREAARLKDSIATLETEKLQAQHALQAASTQLSDILAALQSLALSNPPALLVAPQDINEAARAAMLLSDATTVVQAKAKVLQRAIERLASLQDSLEKARIGLDSTNKELAARQNVLAELMAQKEQERDVVARLASVAQQETARLAAQATSLRDVMRKLERLAHILTPRIKPPHRLGNATTSSHVPTMKQQRPQPFAASRRFSEATGALRLPVAGSVTGRFGKTRPEGGIFEGIRLLASDKAIVTAPFEGRVVFARTWGLLGNMIVLDVGAGYHLLLIGVDAILVSESQTVAAGEPVARLAGRGASLDLEVRKNGEPVDPARWFSEGNSQGNAL